jgi:hypothetical protein
MRTADTHFRDIRVEDRAMIRAAARRTALSVSEWLNWAINSAAKQTRQPQRSGNKTVSEAELTTSALHKRMEHLAGQIDQLLQQNSPHAESANLAHGIAQMRRLEDAINRLCDRLHSCTIEVPPDPTYYASPARPRMFPRLVATRN